MSKIYAIKYGYDKENEKEIHNGLVDTWQECQRLVKGVNGARFKSFLTLKEAREYLEQTDVYLKSEKKYPTDCLAVYVDGSYNAGTEEFSYAAIPVEDECIIKDIISGKGKLVGVKNVRQIAGELYAALMAVDYAISKGHKKVVIVHDYIGICYHATGVWERNEASSIAYFKEMQQRMRQIEIIFVKVDGHSGDLFNNLADEIAKSELEIYNTKEISKWLNNDIFYIDGDGNDEHIISKILNIAPCATEDKFVTFDSVNKED